jgi:hypothetical protein
MPCLLVRSLRRLHHRGVQKKSSAAALRSRYVKGLSAAKFWCGAPSLNHESPAGYVQL